MTVAEHGESSDSSGYVQRGNAHTDSRTSSMAALSDASSTVQPFHVYTCSQVSLHCVIQSLFCTWICGSIDQGTSLMQCAGTALAHTVPRVCSLLFQPYFSGRLLLDLKKCRCGMEQEPSLPAFAP